MTVMLKGRRKEGGDSVELSVNELGSGLASSFVVFHEPIPIRFDDPVEREIYIPTPGEVLMDRWVFVDEVFDASSAKLDIGTFNNDVLWGISTVDLTGPISNETGDMLSMKTTSLNLPHRFMTDEPLKLVISDDGQIDGDPIGGTTGHGELILVTAMSSVS